MKKKKPMIGDSVMITTGYSKAYGRIGTFIGTYVRKGVTMYCVDMGDKETFKTRVEVLPENVEVE